MKAPGETTLRYIAAAIVVLAIAGYVVYVNYLRDKAGTADVLEAQVDIADDSAALGQAAGERAGGILMEGHHATNEDRRAIAAARRPGATAADRERVRRRALEAYLEGQDADCGLQRTSCRPEPPAAPGE